MAIRNKKKNFFSRLKIIELITNSEILPFTLSFSVIAVFFIILRMKGIEFTYTVNQLNESIEKETIINKELKAERAKLLTANRLQTIARKFNLKDPSPEQMILIQE